MVLDQPTCCDLEIAIAGTDVAVPLLNGTTTRPIQLDNAAGTPALQAVLETVQAFTPWYASVHRGAGFKSQLATRAFEDSRAAVGRFFGADPADYAVVFAKNTTESINILARCLEWQPGDVVLCSLLEHHSNLLPWRGVAEVDYIACDPLGRLDLDHAREQLARYAGRLRLVAVSGASNVSGALTPLADLAPLVHAAGAELLVDGAQLAAHRPLRMGRLDTAASIDYLVLAGHKLYAPFGSAALIARRDRLAAGRPADVGGGTAASVTLDSVVWNPVPQRLEAGTPNVIGAVALAAALATLEQIGLERIAAHEQALTAHALRRLRALDGVRVYGDSDPERVQQRLGIIPFGVAGLEHGLVAAILSAEYGIAVRNGSFCAQPYVRRLLGGAVDVGCGAGRATSAGLVRASMGIYTTLAEIDALADALETISRGRYQGDYHLRDGHYQPIGWAPPLDDFLALACPALVQPPV